MKRKVILSVLMATVVGFLNVAGAENKTKKTKPVSLQTFVNSVAGRTYQEIVARFGKPSCEGTDGILYENFVKDERTGEILSVYVDFQPGFPAGTVKRREGRMVVGFSDMKYLGANIICRYYRFEVRDAGDPVVQDFHVYRSVNKPGWVPSCEAISRENDRMERERERKDQIEREETRRKEEAPLKSAVEKLIGKRVGGLSVQGGLITDVSPNWKGEEFVTNEGEKYVLVLGRKKKEPSQGNSPWRDRYDACPECNVLTCYLIEDRLKDGVDYVIFECQINCEKRKVSISILVCKTGTNYPKGTAGPFPEVQYGGNNGEVFRYTTLDRWEDYADNSPIDLIASKIKGEPRMKKTEQVAPTTQAKIVTVTWTFVNIRSGAGNDYPVVTSVNQGDKLTVIGESGEWLNVRLENSKQGWISNMVVK